MTFNLYIVSFTYTYLHSIRIANLTLSNVVDAIFTLHSFMPVFMIDTIEACFLLSHYHFLLFFHEIHSARGMSKHTRMVRGGPTVTT